MSVEVRYNGCMSRASTLVTLPVVDSPASQFFQLHRSTLMRWEMGPGYSNCIQIDPSFDHSSDFCDTARRTED